MRSLRFVTLPALIAAVAVPAGAQISARVHVNIPVGRPAPMAVRGQPHRAISIRPYVSSRYGAWEDYYQNWEPVTVYLSDGQYYDYPVYDYAEPVVVYRYQDELFFPPRDRGWIDFQARRPIYRDARPEYRGGYQYRDTRPEYRNGYDYRDTRPVYTQPRVNERTMVRSEPRGGEVRGSYPRQEQGGQARGGEPQQGGRDRGGRPEQGHSSGSAGGADTHGSPRGAGSGRTHGGH
jgi:hypothetical protein